MKKKIDKLVKISLFVKQQPKTKLIPSLHPNVAPHSPTYTWRQNEVVQNSRNPAGRTELWTNELMSLSYH